MTTVVAADLDRTLIYSRAAIDAVLRPEQVPPLACVELLDGHPLSFMTARAARWLAMLRHHALLVPVTTRTLEQFNRVRLPGGTTPIAVISNGGQILVDGVPDAGWRLAVESRIAGGGAGLPEIVDGLHRQATGPWVLNRRVADDLFCYLVVDPAGLPARFLPGWTRWCADRGWVVSVQGPKIYTLPRALTKEAAIVEVMSRTGADRLLAAGDGALDAGFLSLATAGIRPPHGELAETGWQATHVLVADGKGVLAGEQISRWLAAQVMAWQPAHPRLR